MLIKIDRDHYDEDEDEIPPDGPWWDDEGV